MTTHPAKGTVESRAQRLYREVYGHDAGSCVSAPGRVNLIGDHTDYADGLVLPAALDVRTAVAFSIAASTQVEAVSESGEGVLSFAPGDMGIQGWGAYVAGVAWALAEEVHKLPGLLCAIASDVPIGSGLSSSASLEVALARAWRSAGNLDLDDRRLAELCRAAENRYVGVPCGIMDQFAASLAQTGEALFIDCRTLNHTPLAIPRSWRFIVVDSGVHRRLAGSVYQARVAESRGAARALAIATLRDLRPQQLELLDGVPKQRARHIFTENRRVESAVTALTHADAAAFGRLMTASHESLRNDYEVSGPELDALVEASLDFPGCIGARMTGAGLGGCTVHLTQEVDTAAFEGQLQAKVAEARVVAVVGEA